MILGQLATIKWSYLYWQILHAHVHGLLELDGENMKPRQLFLALFSLCIGISECLFLPYVRLLTLELLGLQGCY